MRGRFGSSPWSGLGPRGQSLGNERGADDRHLARGLDTQPDLGPSRRTTVTQMSSPMKSFSVSLRVNTSMAALL